MRTWHYQLQRVDLDRLRASQADLFVIDYMRTRPTRPLLRSEVDGLKRKPDGSPRVVLAYLSIGEAEDYRFYWQAEWRQSPPAWVVAENCEWHRNYLVRFWAPEWTGILMGGRQSYLTRIQDAGFDGVYLDRVDVYEPLRQERADARMAMIDFVKQLAGVARTRDPGFMVFPQNADTLLADSSYRAVIDGIGRESLVLRGSELGLRNPDRVRSSIDRLKLLSSTGKPVLVVEYPWTHEDKNTAEAALATHGFVHKFATRDLDGRDPLGSKSISQSGPTPQLQPLQERPAPQRPCMDY